MYSQSVPALVSKNVGNALTNYKNWSIFFNAKDYGAKGDGKTDDYSSLSTLINTTINGAQANIIFPAGTYIIGTNLIFPSNINVIFIQGAMLSPNTGITITINGAVDAGLYKIFTGLGTTAGSFKVTRIPVSWFGAVSDGITDDTSAVQKAINIAALDFRQVYIPYNTIYTQGSLVIPRNVLLWDESNDYINIDDYVSDNSKSTLVIRRDNSKVGGVSGAAYGAISVYDTVRDGINSYEWGITSVLSNYDTTGEHVAIYGQGNKYVNSGTTWAGTFEARDRYAGGSTSGTLVGVEVDLFSNGADTTNRIGIDMVVGKNDPNGTTPSFYCGIRISPQNGDFNNGTMINGLLLTGKATTGINVGSSGTYAYLDTGTNTIGMDLSQGTHSDSAIRIKSNEYFTFEGTSTIKMKYNPTSGYIEFYNGATRKGYIDVSGTGTDHAL